jgi:hypothetical protein
MISSIKKPKLLYNLNPDHIKRKPEQTTISDFAFHHSASSINWTDKEIIDLHVNDRGWEWAGYHYIILWNGTIIQTRPDHVIGASIKYHNKGKIAICLVGDFSGSLKPSEDQLNSLLWLTLWKADVHNIKMKDGVPSFVLHNELRSTKCPGFDRAKLERMYKTGVNPLAHFSTWELLGELRRRFVK